MSIEIKCMRCRLKMRKVKNQDLWVCAECGKDIDYEELRDEVLRDG